ncbi:hypothetical protein HDV02_004388 [Globomyces sp. JEL0801]|nr:hypothetical protein HDV02_004388 [Globomyces sp. JEL0801]
MRVTPGIGFICLLSIIGLIICCFVCITRPRNGLVKTELGDVSLIATREIGETSNAPISVKIAESNPFQHHDVENIPVDKVNSFPCRELSESQTTICPTSNQSNVECTTTLEKETYNSPQLLSQSMTQSGSSQNHQLSSEVQHVIPDQNGNDRDRNFDMTCEQSNHTSNLNTYNSSDQRNEYEFGEILKEKETLTKACSYGIIPETTPLTNSFQHVQNPQLKKSKSKDIIDSNLNSESKSPKSSKSIMRSLSKSLKRAFGSHNDIQALQNADSSQRSSNNNSTDNINRAENSSSENVTPDTFTDTPKQSKSILKKLTKSIKSKFSTSQENVSNTQDVNTL